MQKQVDQLQKENYTTDTAITQCNAERYAMLTNTQALDAVEQITARPNSISEDDITSLLGNASVTFAQLRYVTGVQTAAAHRNEPLYKVTDANVMLCANLSVHANVYARKVRRSAAQFSENSASAVEKFEAQQNYFAHTGCYSIVVHKQHAHKLYLYAIYNRAHSLYVHGDSVVDKQHVAQFLTASAARQLLEPATVVHNVTHNIVHDVRVRTIALSNIVQIRARRQLLSI